VRLSALRARSVLISTMAEEARPGFVVASCCCGGVWGLAELVSRAPIRPPREGRMMSNAEDRAVSFRSTARFQAHAATRTRPVDPTILHDQLVLLLDGL
jgi:hypothetical protein